MLLGSGQTRIFGPARTVNCKNRDPLPLVEQTAAVSKQAGQDVRQHILRRFRTGQSRSHPHTYMLHLLHGGQIYGIGLGLGGATLKTWPSYTTFPRCFSAPRTTRKRSCLWTSVLHFGAVAIANQQPPRHPISDKRSTITRLR